MRVSLALVQLPPGGQYCQSLPSISANMIQPVGVPVVHSGVLLFSTDRHTTTLFWRLMASLRAV